MEDKVKAFITLDEENARKKAKELDEKHSAEEANQSSFWHADWNQR